MVDAWKVTMMALMMVGLSGCADVGEPHDASESADVHGAEVGDNNATNENVTLAEIMPVVSIIVDGNVTELVNGTYALPADTNITFDATNSTGNITMFEWTIGNQTLNGTVIQFAFPAGNHTVDLTAIGAANQTAALSLAINATSMGPAAPELVGSSDISFSKAASTFVNGACNTGTQELTFPDGTETQYLKMTLDPSWTGVALSINYKLMLRDADGNNVASASRAGGSDNFVLEASDLALPGGVYTAIGEVCATMGPQVSFTVVGQADHYA